MTPGVNEPVKTPPLESVAGEPNVKNSYVGLRHRRGRAAPAPAPAATRGARSEGRQRHLAGPLIPTRRGGGPPSRAS